MDNNKKITDLVSQFNDNLEEFELEIKSFQKLIKKKNKRLEQPILHVIQSFNEAMSISL